jgi:cell filamentation protein
MLLVHAELCFRANLSVNWLRTSKQAYLDALTKEIQTPNDGHLDTFLKPFVGPPIPRENWLQYVSVLPGLDGIDAESDVSAGYADPAITKEFQEFERRRGYRLEDPPPDDPLMDAS